MSLTGRLTAFFLAALAVVLLGFSTALYLLARSHLYRQLDAQLHAAVDTLTAATEFKSGGVVWEPEERHLSLGKSQDAGDIRWLICRENGEMEDRSPNLAAAEFAEAVRDAARENELTEMIDPQGRTWRLLQRRAQSPHQEQAGARAEKPDPGERVFPALLLTAAISQVPVQATLQTLAWTLGGLSIGVWSLAALGGRRLCRHALRPVTSMATTARAMSASDLEDRLPNPHTGDELEELSQAFNGLLSRVQEAYERQRRFTGDASHQLRTPLTAMLGQMEVCLRRVRSAEEYERVLAVVYDQAKQLRHLVEMLLFLARADAEARLPNLETVDLAGWLEEYRQRWAEHPRAADLQIESAAGGKALARVQPPLLSNLLDNLLDNACKHSDPGSPVIVRLEAEDSRVKLSVEDTGHGIPAEDLTHVFEPFYRSAEARRRGTAGIGLGLAVAERIAKAFGGTMSVQSEPGKFTRFTLELPAVEVAEPAAIGVVASR
jgi:two-component system OmpR family sensor kinase